MAKSIFVNLPVAHVPSSTAFYEAIGMTKDTRFSNDQASAMIWSDTISFMLLSRDFYASFTPKPIADALTTSAVLLALSLDSREEVDAITEAAIAAGGREAHEAEDQGFMYSRAFEDLDGNGFGPFYMDMAVAQTAMAPPEPA